METPNYANNRNGAMRTNKGVKMKKTVLGFGGGLTLILISAFIATFVGWVTNIIYILQNIDGALTGHFILACVGVVVIPLGALHGIWLWFLTK